MKVLIMGNDQQTRENISFCLQVIQVDLTSRKYLVHPNEDQEYQELEDWENVANMLGRDVESISGEEVSKVTWRRSEKLSESKLSLKT